MINDLLPLEILELIVARTNGLENLYQCALVNKLFYTVTIPLLWHSPWNTRQCQTITTQVLANLQRTTNHPTPFGHYIRKLQFRANDPVDKVLEILEQAPFVEDLCLGCYWQLTDHDLDLIARLCTRLHSLSLNKIIPREGWVLPLLTELSISNVGSRDSPLTDTLLVPFYKSHPRLEKLHLRHCRIDKTTLQSIIYLPNLHTLDLDHTLGIDTLGLRSLIKACDGLKVVSLDGSNLRRRRFPESEQLVGRLKALDQKALERIRLNSR